MAEAQSARHCRAAHVVGVTVNLDTRHFVDEKGNFRERRRSLCGQSLVDVVLVHPIADFARAGAYPGVQTSTPKNLSLGTIQYAISKVFTQIKPASAAAE